MSTLALTSNFVCVHRRSSVVLVRMHVVLNTNNNQWTLYSTDSSLSFFTIDYAVCMLTAHAKPIKLQSRKLPKWIIQFDFVQLTWLCRRVNCIQYIFMLSVDNIRFGFLCFFFHFSHRNRKLFSIRYERFNRLIFFYFFCVIFFISTNVVLVHSGWIENAAFSWSAKCGAWVETINISNDRKNQI